MSPLEAMNDVCRHFCGETNAANGLHDDACKTLRQVLREWTALRLDGGAG